MLSMITGLLSKFKLSIYAVVLSVMSTAWFMDHIHQYEKGQAACEQAHQTADTNYIKWKEKDQQKAAAEAVKKSSEVAEHITAKKVEKKHEIEHTKELAAKANTPVSCDLTADELRDFNEAIRRANQ